MGRAVSLTITNNRSGCTGSGTSITPTPTKSNRGESCSVQPGTDPPNERGHLRMPTYLSKQQLPDRSCQSSLAPRGQLSRGSSTLPPGCHEVTRHSRIRIIDSAAVLSPGPRQYFAASDKSSHF